MKIDFSYNKKNINYVSGYILKGKFYRCNYIRFKTLYDRPSLGTEQVEVYNFCPKSEQKGSVVILHGLGSRNIKFLLWMGTHLSSFGINSSIIILPGNYTRVEHNSVSGKSYLWPDMKVMYKFWEHAVVDIISTIDLLEQLNLWQNNNCIFGYCLGGMLSSIVCSIDPRIKETIFMNTGGHFPKILYESNTTKFAKKLFKEGYTTDYFLHDKDLLYKTYEEQLPLVRKMNLRDILKSEEIHPLFRIDPLSYAHLLDKNHVTFIDALYDEILPIASRSLLYKEMSGAKRYLLPTTHTAWLPFEFFLSQYILLKLNIKERKPFMLLTKEKIEIPLLDYVLGHIKDI